jgi:tetrapyrrole methylase family protein/MazG family protein
MLTILGLGPGDPALLTREAWELLNAATDAHLRTRKHPAVAGLPPHLQIHDFDALYEDGADFAGVYARIVDAVIEAARRGDVIYAVPGHPLVGEATVPALLRRAREAGIPARLAAGLSFVEPVLQALQLAGGPPELPSLSFDPLDGLQVCDALALAAMHHPPLNPDRPALVAQIYARAIASDVKLTLLNQYPPRHPVAIIASAEAGAAVAWLPLHTLDHADRFDHLTTLYVPAAPVAAGFEALQETVAHLRAPEGCPWDREQTFQSLRSSLLEETYEVLAAIDEDDLAALQEELGDLLLNAVLLTQIATEAEQFRMVDVIAEVDAKLKRRHPHVFGDVVADSVGEVLANWHAIKQQESADLGKPARASALDGIPPALPALAQAQKMAHKAERAGFRWDADRERATQLRLAKVHEEVDEAVTARDEAHRREELGDLLFTLADLADGFGIDAETALREANLKFARRFRAMEDLARQRGLDMKALALAELEGLWGEVKRSSLS